MQIKWALVAPPPLPHGELGLAAALPVQHKQISVLSTFISRCFLRLTDAVSPLQQRGCFLEVLFQTSSAFDFPEGRSPPKHPEQTEKSLFRLCHIVASE